MDGGHVTVPELVPLPVAQGHNHWFPPFLNSFSEYSWGSCSVPGAAPLIAEALLRKRGAVPILVGHQPQRNNQIEARSL